MKSCCFFGHRKIKETKELKENIFKIIEFLIKNEAVDSFLFGSKSKFNDICLDAVTDIKKKYNYIKRIYVRAEFPYIDEDYKHYLLEHYEETYFPKNIINAGKFVYIERNYEMINKSDYCVVYFDSENLPSNRNSGTKIALEYAKKKNKKIINLA